MIINREQEEGMNLVIKAVPKSSFSLVCNKHTIYDIISKHHSYILITIWLMVHLYPLLKHELSLLHHHKHSSLKKELILE